MILYAIRTDTKSGHAYWTGSNGGSTTVSPPKFYTSLKLAESAIRNSYYLSSGPFYVVKFSMVEECSFWNNPC